VSIAGMWRSEIQNGPEVFTSGRPERFERNPRRSGLHRTDWRRAAMSALERSTRISRRRRSDHRKFQVGWNPINKASFLTIEC